MYAIIRTGGKQYRVTPGQRVRVEALPGEIGQSLELTDVLAVGQGESLKVGAPVVAGAKVRATIRAQDRGPKLVVFKKRRRKGYKKMKGHRQNYTEIEINDITG